MYIVYIDYNWIIGSNLGFFVVENSGKTEFNMINILKWYSGRVSVYVLYMHFWVIPEKCNFCELMYSWGIPRWHSGRVSTCQCRRCKRCGFDPWVGKISWKRAWQPAPVGQEDPLEKEMETHSIILTWRIPWTEEPGRLQSMGFQRVRHNWAAKHTHYLSLLLFVWGFSSF